jgi:CheY-like chemotaxis protein
MAESRKHILFVDDEESFLGVLRDILGHFAGEAWAIHTAPDVGQALTILQEQPIDLLVLDVHMPVIDGLQFLGLLRRTYPSLPRVALSGDTSEQYRAACLNAGALMYLEKPVTQDGWRSLYATLNELVKVQPSEGFRGVLRTVGLQDILQMECLGRSSSILEITTRDFVGRIFIQDGQILHAEAGERTGEEAFNFLMALRGGEFNLQPFTAPPQRTLHESWEFLLMEAARKRDEAAGPVEAVEDQAPAPVPDLAPASAASSAGPPPQPSDAGPPTGVPVPPAAAPAATEGDSGFRPVMEEMLVASPQGDVLFEWQCPQASERIRFLEFISERARQLGQGLPLGQFERLEMEAGPARCVTQVQAERTVLVRRRLQPLGTASEERRA